MVIKSSFKDYYDHVANMYGGGDPRLVYPRFRVAPTMDKHIEIEDCSLVDPLRYGRYRTRNGQLFDYMYLIIAGKPYLLARPCLEPFDPKQSKTDYDISSYRIQPLEQSLDGTQRYLQMNGPRYGVEFGKEYKFLIELSRKVGAPVFVIASVEYTKHWKQSVVTIVGQCPILSRLGVPQMISPEQMYQDIAMFMGNQMKATPDTQPPVELGNTQKILKAGFDFVKSFRHRT